MAVAAPIPLVPPEIKATLSLSLAMIPLYRRALPAGTDAKALADSFDDIGANATAEASMEVAHILLPSYASGNVTPLIREHAASSMS